MNVTISFRHIHHSKRLDEKIRENQKRSESFSREELILSGSVTTQRACIMLKQVFLALSLSIMLMQTQTTL